MDTRGVARCARVLGWLLLAASAACGPVSVKETCSPPRDHGEDTLALREIAGMTVTVGSLDAAREVAEVAVLGFNDFHGQLGAGRRVEGRPLGGAAVLTSYLKAAAGDLDDALIVHAGDMVGASPPTSALFKDEPTIAFVNSLANAHCHGPKKLDARCNVVAGLGNHELDEGRDELQRLLRGEARSQGAYALPEYAGPRFPFVTANVVDARTGERPFAPSAVVEIGGVEIGVVGATVSGATRYLPPRGIASLRFTDEAQAINAEVDALKARGVRAIVVALHQGGEQDFAAPSGSPPVAGRIVDIVSALSPEVDLVVSGHTHTLVNAVMRNRDGGPLLVTQAASAGTAFSHVALRISRETGDLLSATSRIVSTFADEGPGLTPDPEVSALVARFEKAVAARVDAVVGVADEELPNEPTCSGEMALGDLVADAQRASVDADIALVTPAWLRDGLAAGPITWGDLFTVQPFGNRVVSVALTGSALLAILEAQWTDPDKVRVLQISGFTYAWDPGAPPGHRVHDVVVNGRPLDPNATYRTAVSDFLADGGDNLGVLASLRRTPEEADDVEAIVDLLRSRDGRASGASRPRIERRAAAAATTP